MTPFPLQPDALASEIGIQLDQWPGNCHGIAEAVLQLVPVPGMRLARGHYTGYVATSSTYRRSGIQQHSWLVAEDGRILDPTRWAMDHPSKPYIYLGDNDAYDEAGLETTSRMPPRFPTSAPSPLATRLSTLDLATLNQIAKAIGSAAIAAERTTPQGLNNLADSLSYAVNRPADHHSDAAAFYQLLADAGLKALIKIDLWRLVMEPEKIHRATPANRFFALPAFSRPSKKQVFFDLCASFISIERRDLALEDDLEELGYTLEGWHQHLNDYERFLKYDPMPQEDGFRYLPRDLLDPLVVISSFLLGKGFGEDIRVERFAASRGYSRKELDALMREAGERVGYDNRWV